MSNKQQRGPSPIDSMPRYTYGTTGLGDESMTFADRVKLTRTAMDAGIWFHTSDTYGSAMSVLKAAFDEDRANVPKMIFKIGLGANTVDELRNTITSQLAMVGAERLDLGQLCLGGALIDGVRDGSLCEAIGALRDEGIVERFVLQVFPHESEMPLVALRAGFLDGLTDGFIFYFNPLQRYALNPLWNAIQETNSPFIGMRTVCGGTAYSVRDHPQETPWLRARAAELIPIYERTDCKTWTEFSVRFEFGFPQIRSTVGSTTKAAHLALLLESVKDIKPLPADIQSEIVRLQDGWGMEHAADPTML